MLSDSQGYSLLLSQNEILKKENRDILITNYTGGTDMNNEPAIYLSPLKLIYSAYTDEKPCYSASMEKGLEQISQHLSNIPKEEKNAVLRIINAIYQENEQIAFYAGVKSGVRLMEELAEI